MSFASWTHAIRNLLPRNRSRFSRKRRLLGSVLSLAFLAPSAATAAFVGLREVGTGFTTVNTALGNSVSLELYVDTGGLSFEGYFLGVDFTGGDVSAISVTHQSIGLFPDILGVPVIDDGAGTVRKTNQSTFSGPLAGGTYVLDVISFQLDSIDPGPNMTVTPGLFGEVLGLSGGSCPGTVPECSVSFGSVSIVPEPSVAGLLGIGLLVLAGRKRAT